MSGGPDLNRQGRVIGLTSYTGITDLDERGQVHIRTVDDIRATLATAGIKPAREPVDTEFALGMRDIWGSDYTLAVRHLRHVLNLLPAHALAQQNLDLAVEKAGTSADVPLPTADGTKGHQPQTRLIAMVAGAFLVILLPVLTFWARQRSRSPLGRADLPAKAAATTSAPHDWFPNQSHHPETVFHDRGEGDPRVRVGAAASTTAPGFLGRENVGLPAGR